MAEGLKEALPGYQGVLRRVILDRLKLADEVQASIFQGLSHRSDIKSIITIGNEFKDKTANVVINGLLDTFNPKNKLHLEEFCVSHCTCSAQSIFLLLNMFVPKRVLKVQQKKNNDPYAKKDPNKLMQGKLLKGGLLMKLVKQMNSDGMSAIKETNEDLITD